MANKLQEPRVWDLPILRRERTGTKAAHRVPHRIHDWGHRAAWVPPATTSPYDYERNCYTCPAGKELRQRQKEGAIPALGFVEDRDMRLDPLLMDQPIQHLGRAVCSVADQPWTHRDQVFERTRSYAVPLCFGLPDGRCCLDINQR